MYQCGLMQMAWLGCEGNLNLCHSQYNWWMISLAMFVSSCFVLKDVCVVFRCSMLTFGTLVAGFPAPSVYKILNVHTGCVTWMNEFCCWNLSLQIYGDKCWNETGCSKLGIAIPNLEMRMISWLVLSDVVLEICSRWWIVWKSLTDCWWKCMRTLSVEWVAGKVVLTSNDLDVGIAPLKKLVLNAQCIQSIRSFNTSAKVIQHRKCWHENSLVSGFGIQWGCQDFKRHRKFDGWCLWILKDWPCVRLKNVKLPWMCMLELEIELHHLCADSWCWFIVLEGARVGCVIWVLCELCLHEFGMTDCLSNGIPVSLRFEMWLLCGQLKLLRCYLEMQCLHLLMNAMTQLPK